MACRRRVRVDPEGIRWIRTLLVSLAAEGRTVLLSSHLMSEMAVTAEHLVVIGRGRLIADTSVRDLVRHASANSGVSVRSPDATRLRDALLGPDVTIESTESERLTVHGLTSEQVGRRAAELSLTLYELTPQEVSLEDAFMALTGDSVEYRVMEAAA